MAVMTDKEIQSLAERHTSQVSMARELMCSSERVRQLCDRAGVIKFRNFGAVGRVRAIELLPKWIAQLLSARDMAELLNVPVQSLHKGGAHQSLHLRVRKHLVRRLWNEKWTVREISDSLELTVSTIYSIISTGRRRGFQFDRRYKGDKRG